MENGSRKERESEERDKSSRKLKLKGKTQHELMKENKKRKGKKNEMKELTMNAEVKMSPAV